MSYSGGEVVHEKILACIPCRSKKLKCVLHQEGPDCHRCVTRGLACVRPRYQRIPKGRTASGDTSETSNRVASTSTTSGFISASRASNLPEEGPSNAILPQSLSNDVFTFLGEPLQRGDPSMHPLINPVRLLSTSLQDRSISSQHQARLYQPRLDNHHSLQPIDCGVVSLETANDLFEKFMSPQGNTTYYFDPAIHTFEYIRHHSALLFSSILWLSAAENVNDTILRDELFRHMERTILPTIFLHTCRSVEIVQGLMMLSAFHPPSGEMSEDKSWSLLGWAVRMASDLNIHSTITSTALLPVTDENEYRQRRNSERTWMNLWLHDITLAQHTGRRSMLARDPIVILSGNWHIQPLSISQDIAIVALIELHALVILHRSIHEEMLTEELPSNSMIRSYLGRLRYSLSVWFNRWREVSFGSHSSIQRQLAPLYYRLALLQLTILPMQRPQLMTEETLTATTACIYQHCVDYMDAFINRLPPQSLAKRHNATFIQALYVVVLSLKLTKLSSSLSFIESKELKRLVSEVISNIKAVPSFAQHPTAVMYGNILHSLLDEGQMATLINESTTSFTSTITPDPTITTTTSIALMEEESTPSMDFPLTVDPTGLTGIASTDTSIFLDDLELMAWVNQYISSNTDTTMPPPPLPPQQ